MWFSFLCQECISCVTPGQELDIFMCHLQRARHAEGTAPRMLCSTEQRGFSLPHCSSPGNTPGSDARAREGGSVTSLCVSHLQRLSAASPRAGSCPAALACARCRFPWKRSTRCISTEEPPVMQGGPQGDLWSPLRWHRGGCVDLL